MTIEDDKIRDKRIDELRSLVQLDWTKEQERKLSTAFGLIDDVMWECENKRKQDELNAIGTARFSLERIVTAFSLKRMVVQNEKKGRFRK